MHQWAGIKPKVLNQNKMLAQKVTPRSKASTTNHIKTTNQNKALDDEVTRAVQQLLTLNKIETLIPVLESKRILSFIFYVI